MFTLWKQKHGSRQKGSRSKAERESRNGREFSFCLLYGSRSTEAGKRGVGAQQKGRAERREREREREREERV